MRTGKTHAHGLNKETGLKYVTHTVDTSRRAYKKRWNSHADRMSVDRRCTTTLSKDNAAMMSEKIDCKNKRFAIRLEPR
jgi:gamma-glutamyltranspeptidase